MGTMMVLQPHLLRDLAERPTRPESPVLSVYLNLDPSAPTNRRGGYRLALEEMLKQIETQLNDDDKRRHFQEDASWTRKQVELHIPKGRSLVMFCDVSEELHYRQDLAIRLANQVCYGNTPFTRPLAQAAKEHQRYGVVLVDKENARFFVFTMQSIEELDKAFQTPAVRHRRTAGSDHLRSQMTLQRRAATWSGWFLKEVAEILDDILHTQAIDGIVLAGQEDITAELQRLLPKALTTRLIGTARMPIGAKAHDVLEISLPMAEALERNLERQLVDDLVTIARKSQPKQEKAVTGLDATLNAINQARVYRLVYPAGRKTAGSECLGCEILLDHPPLDGKCPYCSGTLVEVDDVIWLAAERVLTMGGKVEEVRDQDACARLEAIGKVGAYLR
jgi:peptide chain release factor subunit 1